MADGCGAELPGLPLPHLPSRGRLSRGRSPDPVWAHPGWPLAPAAAGSPGAVITAALRMKDGGLIVRNHSSHRLPATPTPGWDITGLYLMTAVYSYRINLILHKIWELFLLNSSD